MTQLSRNVLGVVCLAGALAGCGVRGPRAAVETFEATARIHLNGTVDVREQLSIAADAAVTSFERRIENERADGLVFVSASLDGREVGRSQTAGSAISFSDGRALRVRWQIPPEPFAQHVLILNYQARNAVEIYGHRGHVRLRLLDSTRQFDVAAARLSLLPPDGVVLDDQSGISEAGWTVARVSGGVVGERRSLTREDIATVAGELPIDPSKMTDPVWQLNAERADQFAAAFISGGVFILVVGLGILGIVRFEHPRRRTDDADERRVVRRGLRLGGLACVGLAAITTLVTWLTLGPFGIWAMAVPVSILVVGVVFLALAGWIV